MPSLPTAGGSANTWGGQLNTFLQVAHNADGTLSPVPALVGTADGAQALSTGNTIKTATDGNYAVIPVTAAAACTGLILEAPVTVWTTVTIINESVNLLSFAASGTSHVAGGAVNIIPSLASASFTYDGNTSLWYNAAEAPSNTSGSAPVLTPAFANGTAAQLSDLARDYMIYLEVTTGGSAFSLAIGPTSVPANTIISSSTATLGEIISFRLPAGWYVKWSGTLAAIGTQTAIGC